MNKKTHAFTLVEVLVVIAILAALIAILLPALHKAVQHSQTIQCASNMRQQGMCLMFYCSDNQDRLPDPPAENVGAVIPGYGFVYWQERLTKYVVGTDQKWRVPPNIDPNSSTYQSVIGRGIFHCPYYPDTNRRIYTCDIPSQYGLNPRLCQYVTDYVTDNPYKPTVVVGGVTVNQPAFVPSYRLTKLQHPVVVVGEGATTVNQYIIGYYFEYMRHNGTIYPGQGTGSGSFFVQGTPLPALNGGANYLWNDMSVSYEPATEFWVRCQSSAATNGINTRPEWCPWLQQGAVP